MPKKIQITIPPEGPRVRIDQFLAHQSLGLSRTQIQKLITNGEIHLQGKKVNANQKVSPGEIVTITIPDPEPLDVVSQDIPLDILFEDEQLLVVNKPAGMVVHPAAGNREGTLVNALLHHCKNLSGIGGIQRPGIVHRIDKGTSGLLLVAKTDLAHQSLSQQLNKRTIHRQYLAIVYGLSNKKVGFLETRIGRQPGNRKKMAVLQEGGRIAGTHYKILQEFRFKSNIRVKDTESFSLVECKLTTGRTHQIRVHLAYLGHPILGDSVYGQAKLLGLGKKMKSWIEELNGFALHAGLLGFNHPVTNEYMEFKIPPPPAFQNLLEFLKPHRSL